MLNKRPCAAVYNVSNWGCAGPVAELQPALSLWLCSIRHCPCLSYEGKHGTYLPLRARQPPFEVEVLNEALST